MRDVQAAAVTVQHVRVLEKWNLFTVDDFSNAAHVVGPFALWVGKEGIIRCFQTRNSELERRFYGGIYYFYLSVINFTL